MCSNKAKKTKNIYLLYSMHNVERVEDEDYNRRTKRILF